VNFLHPILAGVGLAAVAIPILIHLLMRRRRRPIDFGAMRFLLEAMRQQRRRLRLEQLILLLTRCAVVALIALGLAQPLLGSAGLLGGSASVTLYLLVDDSLTSSAADDAGSTELDRSRRMARDLLDSLSGRDVRAGLITLSSPAEAVVAPASSDLGAMRQLIGQLTSTDAAADLAGAFHALEPVLADAEGEVVVALLSGMRAGSLDLNATPPQIDRPVALLASLPATAPASNAAISAVVPLRAALISGEGPAQQPGVRIELTRSGDVEQPQTLPVRLRALIDQVGPEVADNARFGRGETRASVVLRPEPAADASGWLTLQAEIEADAIAGDNTFRRPTPVREGLRIGLITARRFGDDRGLDTEDPASWVRLALRPGAPLLDPEDRDFGDISLTTIDPGALDAARLATLDAVIVLRPDQVGESSWRRLRLFADGGGLVVIFPQRTGASVWADAMLDAMEAPLTIAREARQIEPPVNVAARRGPDDMDLLTLLSDELEGLAPPVSVSRALEISIDDTGPQTPLLLTDDSPLLVTFRPGSGADAEAGRGLVALMTVALDADWTNLPARPLMVPLMQEIVRQGVGRAAGTGVWPAGSRPQTAQRTVALRRAGEDGAAEIPVDASGRPTTPIRRSGLFEAIDDRGRSAALLAVNADTRGSNVAAQPARAVGDWLGAGGLKPTWIGLDEAEVAPEPGAQLASAALAAGDDRSSVALPLLIAALVLAVVELVLARLFSHAAAERGPGAAARLRALWTRPEAAA
jgi:hypothetical protein